ncbi:MAG: aminotransferase class I/II-fold pyridoxal phosphate-dependent enzyme [Xanthomonadales bacterium]|nr:aminotransferase class I/II-fold pyridoxal phosphate-dependent enzyme [Xanthomonadales bacterium]
MPRKKIETQLIHAGEPKPRIRGAVSMPIFQSATFEDNQEADYHNLGYIRLSTTPNHDALHAKLAALENGEAALVTASGMAAITTALVTHLSSGDHLLAQDCLYGGTLDFLVQDLPAMGVEVDFVDANDPASWADKVRPSTRVFYAESMTNPLLQVGDLEGIQRFARERGLISMIDSTFASPVNFRPLELGFDLVLHSATKYMNGHSDLVAGAVVGSDRLVAPIKKKLDHLGGILDPNTCFLLQRGLKTLALRMERQNANALAVARVLEDHPAVQQVNYPGLASHPQHDRAARLFHGFGGMLSFDLGLSGEETEALISGLELMTNAPSLGGIETLVTRPAASSHSGMDPADREGLGITDGLIRVSVGIEHADDLVQDLVSVLDRVSRAVTRSA